MVVDGKRAALTVVIKVRDRATRPANFLSAHLLRFCDERTIDYCAIVDSLDVIASARLRVALSAGDRNVSAHRSLLGGASFAQLTL